MPYILEKQLDLNTLHKRAGGTGGTTCSLNDTDIRALRHTATGGSATESSFDQFAVSAVHTWTVNTGISASITGWVDGSTTSGDDIGSISPNPANVDSIYNGWDVLQNFYFQGFTNEPIYLYLTGSGATASDSGWEHMVIEGAVRDVHCYREEATLTSIQSSAMQWTWDQDPSSQSGQQGYNPFGSSGDNITVKIA